MFPKKNAVAKALVTKPSAETIAPGSAPELRATEDEIYANGEFGVPGGFYVKGSIGRKRTHTFK